MRVQTKEQHFKDLKETMDKVTESITALEIKMMNNHKELMNEIEAVERKTDEALQLTKKNEAEINETSNHQVQIKKKLTSELNLTLKNEIEKLNIKKLEAQVKGTLIDLEDLRNQSMRSTLVFKNIIEEHHETWEDTCKTLSHFIVSELNMLYSYDDIDLLISRAHKGAENQEDLEEHQRKNHKSPRPIFAQFTNWRVAEEIRKKIVMLNAKKQAKVEVNQMYSKDLTIRRNNSLKRRRQLLNNADNNLQIKLIYPATLTSRRKGSRDRWETLEIH